ncbi:MAG: hypothetical protein P8X82_15170 [Gemmatimonadales bacterium]|jgi:hemerythrin-like domain-containing protein
MCRVASIYEARRERHKATKGIGAAVYSLEHKRMLQLLAKLRSRLQDLARCNKPTSRGIMSLLDQECTFKHLAEHHNMREHNVLYAELDRVTSPEERRELTRRCAREWAALRNESR